MRAKKILILQRIKNRKTTSKIKTEFVLKHLRGEELEVLSREYAVNISDIQQWRDVFITKPTVHKV